MLPARPQNGKPHPASSSGRGAVTGNIIIPFQYKLARGTGNGNPVVDFRVPGIETNPRDIAEGLSIPGKKRIEHQSVAVGINRKMARPAGCDKSNPDVFRPCANRLAKRLPQRKTPRRRRLIGRDLGIQHHLHDGAV